MTPIPFHQLVEWILTEYQEKETVFGVYRPYRAGAENNRQIFERKLETPVGPAAGPHTQLTQNIAAAYFSGSRFFELKTVQILDGEDLPVSKPCIRADDECYNCEWSTELYVPQARDEYIKAWFLLNIMAKEFGLGAMDGFQFNMSVGYDLEGIKSEKINSFIEAMKDASGTDIWAECRQYLLDHSDRFRKITAADIAAISPAICNSVTLSTLHGCPPQEIERIATYLIQEKGLHTFIKCNPTLLGYEYARELMDRMGYDYVAFGDFHFKDDLQYGDAVPMFKRLMRLAEEHKVEFGVKITNTFPVDVKQQELPSEEMYMSGKSLYPLSISLAAKLSEEFGGQLRISYSGGADAFNIEKIVAAGIWPVTVATTLLKPGGYQRMEQIAVKTETAERVFTGIDVAAVQKLVQDAVTDKYHLKAVKPLPSRKIKNRVPLVDCFLSPCENGCPIHQDITAYLELVEAGKMEEAMQVITEKNPLPFITGTICAHNCMGKCTRNFYEDPVHIRAAKLTAAEQGFEGLMKHLKAAAVPTGKTAAVVGGGPSGMAAAFFLSRAGIETTLFEETGRLGGVVRHVIPGFRISDQAIENDISLVTAYGARVELNRRIEDLSELKKKFDAVVLAVGASAPGYLSVAGAEPVNALEFLARFKQQEGRLDVGANVVVIGGGNTAMDTARAAKRTTGVEHVYLVYRRTRRYMPADEEELVMALEDDVEFKELLAPKSYQDGILTCDVMRLGAPDASGRRGVEPVGETLRIPADTIIAAVGERVDTELLEQNGIITDRYGRALTNEATLECSHTGIYVIGDGLNGPATVVEGIRDAKIAAEAIAGHVLSRDYASKAEEAAVYSRRGILKQTGGRREAGRCLSCSVICENCAEVCPNRANLAIPVPGVLKHQILHLDRMCNECGNCSSFCPYESSPYLDKFTLFSNEKDMQDSKNEGFLVLDSGKASCQVRYRGNITTWKAGEESEIPQTLRLVMETVCRDYPWLL